MSPSFKPMLAVPAGELSSLRYPLYASYKFDGIRCYCAELVVPPGDDKCVPLSRSLKPIPNMHIRDKISKLPPGFDGEIMTTTFQSCQSAVMSRQGMPDFKYHVFDYCPNDPWAKEPYQRRLDRLFDEIIPLMKQFPWLVLVKQEYVYTVENIEKLEQHAILNGYEGLILRSTTGHYKYGRSTLNEHLLLKVKQFVDREATIVGHVCRLRNKNEPTRNELGYQERSSHKANMVEDDALGALIVKDEGVFPGVEFQIGSGFTEEDRRTLWLHKDTMLAPGREVKYKYQPCGTKDRPRTPIFICFRDKEDLS